MPPAFDFRFPASRVLVVEDEALVRIALVGMLEDAGCVTLEANSASSAIAIMEQNKEVRMVFTDIEMPATMDGIGLARHVRERWPPTIIVLSSGVVTLRPGDLADDILFLAKPYEEYKLGEILAVVSARLSASGA